MLTISVRIIDGERIFKNEYPLKPSSNMPREGENIIWQAKDDEGNLLVKVNQTFPHRGQVEHRHHSVRESEEQIVQAIEDHLNKGMG